MLGLLADSILIQRRALRVVVDPVEDLGVPEQHVLFAHDLVMLVGEVQEPRWDALHLQDVEQRKTFAFG